MVVTSPCAKVCKLQGSICIGCNRTLGEIKEWSQASYVRKQEILDRIKERK